MFLHFTVDFLWLALVDWNGNIYMSIIIYHIIILINAYNTI